MICALFNNKGKIWIIKEGTYNLLFYLLLHLHLQKTQYINEGAIVHYLYSLWLLWILLIRDINYGFSTIELLIEMENPNNK